MGKKQKGAASGVNFCCGHRPVADEEELRMLRRKRLSDYLKILRVGVLLFMTFILFVLS